RWSYSIADRLDWQAGYAHRLATRTDRQVVDGVPSMSQQSNRADSLYGEGTLRTLDGAWALTAGLRYFTDHLEALGTVDDTVLVTDSTFSSLNPRLVVAHQFSADHLWYASIASGFRSGQLQPITSLAAAERLGVALPLSIDPDEILSGEIGFKRLLARRRLLIEGALFQSHWKGLPVRVPIDDAINGIANSKGALIRGAELGVRYSTLSSLSLEFGASVLDAVYVADVPGTPLAKGTRVYNVPKYTGSASVSYAWALGGLTATASVTGLYNSRRATSLTVGSSGDSIFSSSLRMGIESPRGWALHVYGDNLGDDRGAVDGRNSFGAATRLRPRTFGIEFGFTY
ncbi:MAG: TonB-dependent receptor, partial [Paracoccaceae bacterium]